ncbi:MAG: imidazoleglycerol-phosphate dehydratase [Dehalococcoidia bacterium]|nr:imidazoleglycerol-phosphate dehydratase [Dehalococcoidia bacterium]
MSTKGTSRKSSQNRVTGETDISVTVDLDGNGDYQIDTGNGMFDHLIAQLSRHGLMDINLKARGDIHVGWHHLVEDTAIVMGRAFKEAVGDGAGIHRMGHTYVPLDEALVLSVVDYSGRGYSVIDLPLTSNDLGDMSPDLVRHFLETFSREGAFNLHLRVITGINNHHMAEAAFKSLARSLKKAIGIDPRQSGRVSSTKGTITG